jgi:hypothetical protein
VQLIERKHLEQKSTLTWLVDGWEDLAKRNLYASMAQQRGEAGILLNIDDTTGQRVDAHQMVAIHKRALEEVGLVDMDCFVAITTDDPSVMRKYRRLLVSEWPRLLVCSMLCRRLFCC